MKMTRK